MAAASMGLSTAWQLRPLISPLHTVASDGHVLGTGIAAAADTKQY